MSSVVATIDAHGRVVIPKRFREGALKGAKEVAIVPFDDHIRIKPRNVDLSKYIDSILVEVSNFSDYHLLRRELRAKGSASP